MFVMQNMKTDDQMNTTDYTVICYSCGSTTALILNLTQTSISISRAFVKYAKQHMQSD